MVAISLMTETIFAQLRANEQAGAEELMLKWLDFEDTQSIAAFAETVLPRLEREKRPCRHHKPPPQKMHQPMASDARGGKGVWGSR